MQKRKAKLGVKIPQIVTRSATFLLRFAPGFLAKFDFPARVKPFFQPAKKYLINKFIFQIEYKNALLKDYFENARKTA